MEIWLGTSGYAYADWVGQFYPKATRSGEMLAHYARHFPLVELNFTYYRLPTPQDLERQRAKAPPGFQFLVKLHQSLSHQADFSTVAQFRAALEPMRQAGCLMGVLCQYPQRFHRTQDNRAKLVKLAEHFQGIPYAVEFRHRSWAQPEVTTWLAANHLHLVAVDAPDIPALYPSGFVQSTRLVYVRFHSRRASSWYESDKERYDYLYSDEELQGWLEELAKHASTTDRALLLFNNCRRTQAAQNAQRVKELLEQMGLGGQVVQPFATLPEPPEDQGWLF